MEQTIGNEEEIEYVELEEESDMFSDLGIRDMLPSREDFAAALGF